MKIEVANRLEGIGEYYFSKKLREIEELNKNGQPVINLGIGSPDMPPHPDVIKVLQEESAKPNVHAYQNYKGIAPLRKAIASWYEKWYGVLLDADSEILPLIGSKEGIMHICMTYVERDTIVLIPNPGYPTYRSAAKIAGGKIIEYNLKEENSWFPDLQEIEKKLETLKSEAGVGVSFPPGRPGWALMWVNYPHMPTGQLPTKDLFEQLISFAKKHNILICNDNPYSFILNEKPISLLSVDGAKDVAIELNSLSKSHNMAGWRVGMLCGSKERIDEVLRFKTNMDSGMFLPLQSAAAKALSLGEDWYKELNFIYKKRREKVFQLLDELNCEFDKKQAGLFIWSKIPDKYANGYELSDEVLKRSKVFITPGGIFGSAGDNYIRISLCSTEEKLTEALERIQNSTIKEKA